MDNAEIIKNLQATALLLNRIVDSLQLPPQTSEDEPLIQCGWARTHSGCGRMMPAAAFPVSTWSYYFNSPVDRRATIYCSDCLSSFGGQRWYPGKALMGEPVWGGWQSGDFDPSAISKKRRSQKETIKKEA